MVKGKENSDIQNKFSDRMGGGGGGGGEVLYQVRKAQDPGFLCGGICELLAHEGFLFFKIMFLNGS